MLGALAGDFIGSVFEWHNVKTKDFPIIKFVYWDAQTFIANKFTDDSIMTVAVAEIVKNYLEDKNSASTEGIIKIMQKWGRKYPHAGWGGHFRQWISEENPKPYNSWGNGALMRISPVGLCKNLSLEEKLALAEKITNVSHNSKQAIQSVKCYTEILDSLCQFNGISEEKDAANKTVKEICGKYKVSFPLLDEIRPKYKFDVSCQGTLPVSVSSFLEANDFEYTIRNAISVGGDSDTIAAIAGGMAQAFYKTDCVRDFLNEPIFDYHIEEPVSIFEAMKFANSDFIEIAEKLNRTICGENFLEEENVMSWNAKERERKFKKWLTTDGGLGDSTSGVYCSRLKSIEKHTREKTKDYFSIFECEDISRLRGLEKLYGSDGLYSEIGAGVPISALRKYIEFCESNYSVSSDMNITEESLSELMSDSFLESLFLKNLDNILPGYKWSRSAQDPKRKTIILENEKEKSVIVAILERGKADNAVFNDLNVPLKNMKEFFGRDGKTVKGLIVCGEIDEALKLTCENRLDIEIKTYDIGLSLK